jgi:hypothetical protein
MEADIGTGECNETKDHTSGFETTLGADGEKKWLRPTKPAKLSSN